VLSGGIGGCFQQDAAAAWAVPVVREEFRKPAIAVLRVADAVVVVSGGEDDGDLVCERGESPAGALPLLFGILIPPAPAAALGNAVLFDEIAFVQHELDAPWRKVVGDPLAHAVEVLLIGGELGVILGIRENRDGPASADAFFRVREGRQFRGSRPQTRKGRREGCEEAAAGEDHAAGKNGWERTD
jgi:hypothetical protein